MHTHMHTPRKEIKYTRTDQVSDTWSHKLQILQLFSFYGTNSIVQQPVIKVTLHTTIDIDK